MKQFCLIVNYYHFTNSKYLIIKQIVSPVHSYTAHNCYWAGSHPRPVTTQNVPTSPEINRLAYPGHPLEVHTLTGGRCPIKISSYAKSVTFLATLACTIPFSLTSTLGMYGSASLTLYLSCSHKVGTGSAPSSHRSPVARMNNPRHTYL